MNNEDRINKMVSLLSQAQRLGWELERRGDQLDSDELVAAEEAVEYIHRAINEIENGFVSVNQG